MAGGQHATENFLARTGVVFIDHTRMRASTPIASLWSYDTQDRRSSRPIVARNADGENEFWLDRTDPLLNTILPSTHISLIVNFGDPWAAGFSLANSELLPQTCVVGPTTRSRILRVGPSVRALGVVVAPSLAEWTLGVPASALVDSIVPLEELWPRDAVERILYDGADAALRDRLLCMKDRVMTNLIRRERIDAIEAATRLIGARRGQVAIGELAAAHGFGRQRFAQRFRDVTGLHPKLFARLTRFQSLIPSLLRSNVSRWASVALDAGYYDQAHMINEFRELAGSSPTTFFQPRGTATTPPKTQLRGKPSDWQRDADGG